MALKSIGYSPFIYQAPYAIRTTKTIMPTIRDWGEGLVVSFSSVAILKQEQEDFWEMPKIIEVLLLAYH